ncbi:16790_t:CDS:2, partial [Dentiscutata erythropus]
RITILTRSSSLNVEINSQPDNPPTYEEAVTNTSRIDTELRNHLSEQVANEVYQRLESRINSLEETNLTLKDRVNSLEDTNKSFKETKKDLTNFIYLLFLIICFGSFYIYRINEINSTLLHNSVDDRVKKEHFCRLLIEL